MHIVWIILAIISALYGALVLSTASGTGFFGVWFALAGIFVLFALIAKTHLWARFPGGLKAVLLVIFIAGLSFFTVVEGIIGKGFSERGKKDLDYLIVLGAQVRENGPSLVLRYRLDTAYDYLIENTKTRCIVSGGQGHNEPYPEAEGMKMYLVARGIEEERILTEPDSLSTTQNIEYSKALLDPDTDTVGIVTNNFHVFRGTMLARKAGLDACGIAAPSSPLFLPNNMLREFFGVMKDFLQGNL